MPSLASHATAILVHQYQLVVQRMRRLQWVNDLGVLVELATAPAARRVRPTEGSFRFDALEPRMLMSATLYYDTSASAGLQGGSGTWSTSATNWNTAADGSGSRVAWTNGDDAVFSASGGTVTISGGVTVSSITISATGYTVSSSTLTLSGSASISANQNAVISSVVAGSAGLTSAGSATLTLAAIAAERKKPSASTRPAVADRAMDLFEALTLARKGDLAAADRAYLQLADNAKAEPIFRGLALMGLANVRLSAKDLPGMNQAMDRLVALFPGLNAPDHFSEAETIQWYRNQSPKR